MFEFETFSGIDIFENFESTLHFAKHASPRETGGPVVKTGPTAGQNRSRNKDGRWRKKRSDAGQPRTTKNN